MSIRLGRFTPVLLVSLIALTFSMAWRSSGATNAALIANLASNGLITTERVKNAMAGVRSFPIQLKYHRTAPS
jgi:hypothetical protein